MFCFLPWAHLTRSHAVVDLLWGRYPAWLRRVLTVLASALLLLLWALLVWRMGAGMLDYRATQERTFILQWPVWWGYALSMPPAVLGCLACAWRLLEDLGLARPPAHATGGGG